MTRDESVIEFGSFRLNPAERSLAAADGKPIQLTRKLYDTLLFMVERPGRLLAKEALLDAVWKGAVVEENTLSRTISALRQILGERGGEHRYIETVSGVGYRFIAAVSAAAARARPEITQPGSPALAVLPFEDLSREGDQAYFADGVAEDVLNRLTAVKGLRVIAKSSSFRFRDLGQSAQAIGRSLGVEYLLVGAVRKEGTRLRVTAQLIDAATDSQRWSDAFDRELELAHVFAIQDDIARAVASALSATLGVGGAPTAPGATQDFEAYDLFLRARASLDQSGAPGTIRGAELFRAAVVRDPNFAEAWLGLAQANYGLMLFAPERSARAREDLEEAAARAVAVAPRWWRAQLFQGVVAQARFDWFGCDRAIERAIELAPSERWSLQGNLAAQVNDASTAIEHFRVGVRDDPLSLLASSLLQMQLSIAGRHDEADKEYRRSFDLVGDREMAEHLVLHRSWARGAPFDDAFRILMRRYLDLTQTKPLPVLDEVYPVFDEPRLALEKLRAAVQTPEYRFPARQLVVGWWLAAYGDVEASFETLWRSHVEMRHFNMSWLWLPVLKPVRGHPRFPDLLERVGLAAYLRAKNRLFA